MCIDHIPAARGEGFLPFRHVTRLHRLYSSSALRAEEKPLP
jgi:hypothetical protein